MSLEVRSCASFSLRTFPACGALGAEDADKSPTSADYRPFLDFPPRQDDRDDGSSRSRKQIVSAETACEGLRGFSGPNQLTGPTALTASAAAAAAAGGRPGSSRSALPTAARDHRQVSPCCEGNARPLARPERRLPLEHVFAVHSLKAQLTAPGENLPRLCLSRIFSGGPGTDPSPRRVRISQSGGIPAANTSSNGEAGR
jgi:hypothetical protein